MKTKSGGWTMRKLTILVAAAMLAAGSAAQAAGGGAERQVQAAPTTQVPYPAELVRGLFIAAIDIANHAARSTSDTVHHNAGNVMDTVAKARGFVRDTVSGVLGNARKLTGMVGDVMPFTEHHHYEAGSAPGKTER